MATQYIDLPSVGNGHWKAPVVLTSDLPLIGNNIGDVRIAEDTNTIYVWTGSAWLAVATPGAAIAIDALLGDVTAVGPGAVPATVAFVGGKSAAAVAQSVTDTQAATSANTALTLVKRDASGNFSAGIITASLIGNVTGNVSGSAASFTGSLSGDVTGTQSATVVSLVGGQTAANVATATSLVNTAQSGNKVLASPANGSSGAPAFRVLVTADIPAFTISSINSNTSGALDIVYLVDTSGGAFNFTLPAPVSGHRLVIKDAKGTFQTNPLSVLQHSSELIEGLAATKLLQTNWGAWSLFTDGTNWYMGPN